MSHLQVTSRRRIEAIDVTDLIVTRTWPDGYVLVSVPHTTAALVIGEGDPEMLEDYERVAAELFAPFEPFRHHRNDNPNAAAHLVSSLAGTQLLLPVRDGRVALGTWQRIVLIELDGPKKRTLELGSVSGQPVEV
jgi:secondary thiamine-phosphate synthase enzyme